MGIKKASQWEFSKFCRSDNVISVIKTRRLNQVEHVVRIRGVKSTKKNLIGKPTGRSMRRWEDNIRINSEEWIHRGIGITGDPLVNAALVALVFCNRGHS